MRRIREILLNESIGAIAIGMLLAQGAGVVISVIMRPVAFYMVGENRTRSIFGSSTVVFPWGSIVGPMVNLLLYALIIFALLYWLYLKPVLENSPTKETDDESGQA